MRRKISDAESRMALVGAAPMGEYDLHLRALEKRSLFM
jgi:hypothetical protein